MKSQTSIGIMMTAQTPVNFGVNLPILELAWNDQEMELHRISKDFQISYAPVFVRNDRHRSYDPVSSFMCTCILFDNTPQSVRRHRPEKVGGLIVRLMVRALSNYLPSPGPPELV